MSRLAILLLALAPLAAALGHDVTRSFILTSDQDIVHVYEALRLNQGLAQHYDDHTGYVSFVLLAWWLGLLKLVGLVGVFRLEQLPAAGPGFDAAYAQLVVAGRVLSALLAGGFVLVMARGLRRLTGEAGLALALAAVFATSNGLVNQALILRTELPAALLAVAGFFLLLDAIRRPDRPHWLMAAAALCWLALMAKMQAIFLVVGFPVLALAFAERQPASSPAAAGTVLWGLGAAALALPAGFMVISSIQGNGLYQMALALYGTAAMAAYVRLNRLPAAVAIRGAAALVAGLSLAQLGHLLYHTSNTTLALTNLVEHMSKFSTLARGGSGIATLVEALGDVAMRQVSAGPWPYRVLEAAVLLLAVVAWRQGRRREAVQAGLLLGLALGFELVSSLRAFFPHYRIFVEAWTLIAFAILARPYWPGRKARIAGFLLGLSAWQAVLMADPALVPVQPPDNACGQAVYMTIRDRFCP